MVPKVPLDRIKIVNERPKPSKNNKTAVDMLRPYLRVLSKMCGGSRNFSSKMCLFAIDFLSKM